MNFTKKLIFGLLLAGALFTTACGSDGPKEGDTCAKEADCGTDLSCNMNTKKCEKKADKKADGDTCAAHTECTSGFCDSTCKAAPADKSVADGGTCSDAKQCSTTNATCDANKCTPPAPKLANGKDCDAHDKCNSGFCDLAGTKKCADAPADKSVADGGTCSDAKQCSTTNATCDANKCTPPAPKLANGETCTKAKECQSDFCDVNAGKCAAPVMPKGCTKTSDCTAKEVCGVFASGSMKICTPKCDADPDICPSSYPCGEVTTTDSTKVQACGTT